MLCGGEEEFLMELFELFTRLPIKEELSRFRAENDYKNYCIRIHGFKNNAYPIGANALGDLAYEMEQMTRESMPDEIDELQKRLFEQYDRICEKYKAI